MVRPFGKQGQSGMTGTILNTHVKGTKPAAGRFGVNFDKLDQEYLANNIEIWPIGIAGNIVITIIIDDQNIMLAIAASSSLPMRNG